MHMKCSVCIWLLLLLTARVLPTCQALRGLTPSTLSLLLAPCRPTLAPVPLQPLHQYTMLDRPCSAPALGHRIDSGLRGVSNLLLCSRLLH